MNELSQTVKVSESFQAASGKPRTENTRTPTAPPFSLRLTASEREYLKRQAGGKPLGVYIRERLLGEQAQKRKTARKPKTQEKQLALVLAELGNSRLSSNLNQLAKSANRGTLDVSRDVEQDLQDACAAVLAMRDALILALGLKTP